jgi:hypothetical protein
MMRPFEVMPGDAMAAMVSHAHRHLMPEKALDVPDGRATQ